MAGTVCPLVSSLQLSMHSRSAAAGRLCTYADAAAALVCTCAHPAGAMAQSLWCTDYATRQCAALTNFLVCISLIVSIDAGKCLADVMQFAVLDALLSQCACRANFPSKPVTGRLHAQVMRSACQCCDQPAALFC
jgi:hypothetical protein